MGDLLATAVDVGALGVPRAENGLSGHVELGARVLGEVDAGLLAHDRLVLLDELGEGVHVQLVVELDAALGLLGVQAAEKCSPSMSRTVLPNIWMRRR